MPLTIVTFRQEEEAESGIETPRFGFSLRDMENLCHAKGLKFARVTQTTNHPITKEEMGFWIDRGVDVIIVELY